MTQTKNMDGSDLNLGTQSALSQASATETTTTGAPTLQSIIGQRRSLGRIRSTRLLSGLYEEGAAESEALFIETLANQDGAKGLWTELLALANGADVSAEAIQSVMQRVSAACSARVNIPEVASLGRGNDPWAQASQWYAQLASEAQKASVPVDSLKAVVIAGVFLLRSRIKDPLLRSCGFEKWLARASAGASSFDVQSVISKAVQDSWNELRTRAMAEISAHQERKLNLRREKIVELAKQLPVLRIQDVIRHLPGVPRRTLERDLQVLAREMRLRPRGEKKGRTYTLAT